MEFAVVDKARVALRLEVLLHLFAQFSWQLLLGGGALEADVALLLGSRKLAPEVEDFLDVFPILGPLLDRVCWLFVLQALQQSQVLLHHLFLHLLIRFRLLQTFDLNLGLHLAALMRSIREPRCRHEVHFNVAGAQLFKIGFRIADQRLADQAVVLRSVILLGASLGSLFASDDLAKFCHQYFVIPFYVAISFWKQINRWN